MRDVLCSVLGEGVDRREATVLPVKGRVGCRWPFEEGLARPAFDARSGSAPLAGRPPDRHLDPTDVSPHDPPLAGRQTRSILTPSSLNRFPPRSAQLRPRSVCRHHIRVQLAATLPAHPFVSPDGPVPAAAQRLARLVLGRLVVLVGLVAPLCRRRRRSLWLFDSAQAHQGRPYGL